MRVEDLYPQAVRSPEPSGQAEKSADSDRLRADGISDLVSLSRLSQALLLYSSAHARLEQLRALLAAGNYQIRPLEISRRIVEFYLEPDGEDLV